MTHKLTKTENYLLVVDDSEIKEGDFTYHHVKGIYNAVIDGAYINQKKIIAHLPLNNSPILEGVPLLPPIKQEDDVEKLANEYFTDINPKQSSYQNGLHIGFKAGYNTAREKYKYTEEDVRYIIMHSFLLGVDRGTYSKKVENRILQSLHQYPTEFISDDEISHEGNGTYSADLMDIGVSNLKPIKVPKTITTAQGIQWVGKYK